MKKLSFDYHKYIDDQNRNLSYKKNSPLDGFG